MWKTAGNKSEETTKGKNVPISSIPSLVSCEGTVLKENAAYLDKVGITDACFSNGESKSQRSRENTPRQIDRSYNNAESSAFIRTLANFLSSISSKRGKKTHSEAKM